MFCTRLDFCSKVGVFTWESLSRHLKDCSFWHLIVFQSAVDYCVMVLPVYALIGDEWWPGNQRGKGRGGVPGDFRYPWKIRTRGKFYASWYIFERINLKVLVILSFIYFRGPKENQWSVPLAPLGRQGLLVYQAMASLVLLDLLGHQDLQGPLGHPWDMVQVKLI